jgi:peptidoglycan/LPS O-acetylase OafA/YrhL
MLEIGVSSPTRRVNTIAGRKLRSLDGLRAIAVILVFFHHMKDHIPVLNWATFYFQSYVWQGWIGVDLFFVLSGFLITGILMDTREATNYFSGFYARRVLRIFPLYYVVLIGVIAASQVLTHMHGPQAAAVAGLVPLPQDRWVYFCYLTNWIGLWKQQWVSGFSSILAHFWSLGVEEQFYFFWPLVVWLVRPRAIPWIAGIVAVLSAVIRFAWAAHIGIQMLVPPISIEIAIATICRLDALFIGALCAYLFRTPSAMQRVKKWLPWIAISGVGSFFAVFSVLLLFPERARLLLYGPAPVAGHSLEDAIRLFLLYGGYTALAAGFGALVLLAADTEEKSTLMQKILQSRALAPIGKYSYGIYVFHVPILGLASIYLFPRLTAHSAEEFVITQCAYIVVLAAASFFTAAISYELFEKRILAHKRYFEPKYDVAGKDLAEAAKSLVDNVIPEAATD